MIGADGFPPRSDAFAVDPSDPLPDPDRDPQFYRGVPARRLAAFLIDLALILLIDAAVMAFLALLGLLTLGLGWLLMAPAWAATGFVYRVWTLGAGASATPGMRLTGIEFRTDDARPFGFGEAFLHTLLFYLSMAVMLAQLVSVVLMATTRHGRGLPDMIVGATAINSPE